MLRLRVDPDAEQDLVAAVVHYENEREGLGLDLLEEYREVARYAAELPNVGSLVTDLPLSEAVRRFQFHRFPYQLITMLLEDELFVIAVAHHSREPGYWTERLKRR
jgi:toxin ParE1/3/4